mmetsp:Transcript_3350/g.6556  ORF Transcript_3350/g.6556 Transcript_3350/m.6556 type:complete len:158 (-) Transcript_3350:824-1297(-)
MQSCTMHCAQQPARPSLSMMDGAQQRLHIVSECFPLYHSALYHYRKGNFEEAAKTFESSHIASGGADNPSKKMAERCRELHERKMELQHWKERQSSGRGGGGEGKKHEKGRGEKGKGRGGVEKGSESGSGSGTSSIRLPAALEEVENWDGVWTFHVK